MPNQDHLAIVKEGAAAIQAWRKQRPGERLDLREADLQRAELRGANLRGANLTGANLSHGVLFETVFANTNLTAVRGLETCRHNVSDHRGSNSQVIDFERVASCPIFMVKIENSEKSNT